MSKALNQLLLLAIFSARDQALGLVDYCKNHTFDHVPHHDLMHFSKENSEQEYAVVDSFKSLHCCSHGYRSIEWFKDGKPYPWPTDVSTLIIYPESGNQTIYSQVTAEIDSGGYWCIVRNDTHHLRHDVLLKVSDSLSSVGPPKTTYRPKNQFVNPEHDARFYCEAYVGNIDLPDAKSEITWERFGLNDSFIGNSRVKQHIIVREEKQVLGSYLLVANVQKEDFGEYTCKISNTGDQVLELSAWLKEQEDNMDNGCSYYPTSNKIMMFGLIIITAVISTITFLRFGPHFKLISKRVFHRSRAEDGKEQDVLIIYHEKDSDIVLNSIIPVLLNRYQYSCILQPIAKESAIGDQIIKTKASYSRRLMIIMTPFITENEWSCERINSCIEKLLDIHLKVICVFYKHLPYIDIKLESGKDLKETLQKVHCIQYCNKKEHHFWASVRLGLPVRKKTSNASRESLEELV